MSAFQAWSTQNELDCLARIGQHSPLTVDLPRLPLLRNALAAARRRAHWGCLDRARILAELERLILEGALAAELEGVGAQQGGGQP